MSSTPVQVNSDEYWTVEEHSVWDAAVQSACAEQTNPPLHRATRRAKRGRLIMPLQRDSAQRAEKVEQEP